MNIKQLAIIGISIFSIASLSVLSVVYGAGNPWQQVWVAIIDLQSRVSSLEGEQDHVHTVRYVEPSEYTIYSTTKTKIATFTLTPGDASNNAILDYWFYFEYKGTTTTDLYLQYEIDISWCSWSWRG